MSDDKLKPCPFCGGEAEVEEDYINSFIAVCGKCFATARRMYSPSAAAKKWNRRTEVK